MQHENQGQAIANLQRYLRQLSFFDSTIGDLPIDGIFDAATENALRAFQARVGLPQSGVADQETFERLYEAYLQSLAERDAPVRLAHFPRLPERYTVEVGETQFLVSIIQNALRELAVLYDELGDAPLSGTYDEATAAAVRRFQEIQGLPATGGVDLATWNALADAYNRIFEPYFRQ